MCRYGAIHGEWIEIETEGMFLPNTGGQEGEEGRRREKKESSPSELNISRAVWVAAQ